MSNRTIHTLGTSLAATLTAAALAFAPVTAWAGDLAQVVSADEAVSYTHLTLPTILRV